MTPDRSDTGILQDWGFQVRGSVVGAAVVGSVVAAAVAS